MIPWIPVDMTTQLPGSRGLPGEKYSNIIMIQNTLPKKTKTQEVKRNLKTLTWEYVPELNPTEHLCGISQRDETAKVFQQNKSVLVLVFAEHLLRNWRSTPLCWEWPTNKINVELQLFFFLSFESQTRSSCFGVFKYRYSEYLVWGLMLRESFPCYLYIMWFCWLHETVTCSVWMWIECKVAEMTISNFGDEVLP